MNRRELIMSASAVLASSLGASILEGQAGNKPRVGGTNPGIAKSGAAGSGVSVFFHGLWGFWIGAPDPSSKQKGVLAFTPDAGHTLLAGLSNVGASGTLAPGAYTVNSPATQTDPASLLAAILAYPSGFLFDNRSTGDPVSVDLSAAWASVWLPFPDTIYPGYGIEITPDCEPFQGSDVTKYRKGTKYPTTQQFVYGTADKATLVSSGTALFGTTTDQPELQFATLPPLGPGAGFAHESMAFAKLVSMLKRGSGPIDIKIAKPLENCHSARISLKHSDAPKLVKWKVFSVPPANCAGGNGFLVGP